MLAFISFVGGSLTTMISLSYIVVSMGWAMKQFHDGISSKTFKKEYSLCINWIDLIGAVVFGLIISINF